MYASLWTKFFYIEHFYSPILRGLGGGHLDLPLSILPSIRLSVRPKLLNFVTKVGKVGASVSGHISIFFMNIHVLSNLVDGRLK